MACGPSERATMTNIMDRAASHESIGVAQSSPSSPEFLLPAFENSLQLSNSPILEQCSSNVDNSRLNDNGSRLDQPPTSSIRIRRGSKSQAVRKLLRSSSGGVAQLESQPALDATDIRKFRKADQHLTQSVNYLSKKMKEKAALPNGGLAPIATQSELLQSPSNPVRPGPSPLSRSPEHTGSTSPSATPSRRSRFARAFATSPPISPSMSPAASPRPPQTPRTNSGRRWSQALHAILSPSPSLPRTLSPSLASAHDIAWAEATDSSPIVNSTEISRWEIIAAVEGTRAAQAQLLKTIKELAAKLDNKPVEELPELKECVLFLAQFLYCGGQVPDMSSLTDQFNEVRSKGNKLCRSLAKLRNQELSKDSFQRKFKQPDILCHCLSNGKEADMDVFGIKNALSKSDVDFAGRLKQFMHDYERFTVVLRIYHCQYRLERRNKRRERRLQRIDKANVLYQYGQEHVATVSTEAAEIATLSTQELLQHALKHALADGLFSNDDIEAFDPRLMLTLPRLCLYYGIRHSAFPADSKEEEHYSVSMEVFLPRICRHLPYTSIVALKMLSEVDAQALARRLSGVEEQVDTTMDAKTSNDDLFKAISSEADSGTSSTRDPRSNKLLSRALALHLSEGAEDFSMDDDSTISRAYIVLMGLAAT